jgi:hypothetical protein
MKNLFFVFLFAVIIFSFANSTAPNHSVVQAKAMFVNDSIIDTLTLTSIVDTNKQKIYSSVRFFFPTFSNEYDWLNNEVQKLMLFSNHVDTFKKPVFKNFIMSYQKNFESYVKDSGSVEWYFDNSCTAEKINDSTLFLTQGFDSYSGGAHPIAAASLKYFQLQKRKELTLIDFMKKAEDTVEIRKMALLELKQMKNILPGEKLDDDAGMFINDESFYLSKNFYLSDTTLSFYYNQYEIQAYAFGPVEINIDKKKLKNILK